MAKIIQFKKKQKLHIETWGLTVYCETEAGEWKQECEAVDRFDYHRYEKWVDDDHWGHQTLGTCDVHKVVIIAKLPKWSDPQSVVAFCAGLAHATVTLSNPQNVSTPFVSRLAGVIFSNLKVEEVEVEDGKPREPAVGSVYEQDGKQYRVEEFVPESIEKDDCGGCPFTPTEDDPNCHCQVCCGKEYRSDGKNVRFREIKEG